MRLGCGCLIGIVLVVLAVGGLGWATYQLLADPHLPPASVTAGDSQRAQEKIYAIVTRSAPRGRPVVLSEAEVNAFLARNLGDLPLTELRVNLTDPGRIRFAGRTRLHAVLGEPPLTALRDALPASWLSRVVWLQLAATPRMETTDARRRFVRLDVQEFSVGRQRLPTILVRLILDPGTLRVLRWSVPETVEDVRFEPGRAVVRLAS